MPLQSTIVLDLSELDTSGLATAGRAIASVQMCLSRGKRVIAVVAPDPSRERRDLAAANRLGPIASPSDRAAALVGGPLEAAEMFAGVLAESGIRASAAETGLLPTTRGHALDAEPRRVSAAGIAAAFDETDVLVIPGGVGRDENGSLTSLGSGTGSLSAVFLAERMALPVQRPGRGAGDAGSDASSLGQRKAQRFVERHEVAVQASAEFVSGGSTPTTIAMIGDSDAGGLFLGWLSDLGGSVSVEWYDASQLGSGELIAASPDIVVDTSSGAAPVYEAASWALRSGRTLLTTNAALLAERGGGLSVASLIGGGTMRASGAVVGCPSLASLLDRTADWPGVSRVQGTFSPAGDRILDLRARGLSTEQASRIVADELGLSPAQIDEAIRGEDAARTLGAIAPLAFNTPATVRARPRGPEHVSDRDLARAAAQGRRFRVVATTERIGDTVSTRVGPVPLREDDPLVSTTPGTVNAIVQTRDGAEHRATGTLHQPGSVAAALLADFLQTRRVPSPAQHAARIDANSVLGITA